MPSTYKTPGVYVEEITKFPPSVASVETAIPAFIGYTEKAEKNGESLTNIPTRITSFLEFEQYFGGPPPRDVIVRLNASNQYLKAEHKGTTFLLYDSLRLFYNNGGGICFIVSVGNYSTSPSIGDDTKGILGGLKALEKYDEPTLLLSPDAVSLDSDLYTFNVQAINQCNKLQDRFVICDLLKSDEKTVGQTHEDRIAGFRDNIGINYLKYGAAYTPWLKTSLPLDLKFRDVIFASEAETIPDSSKSRSLLLSATNNSAIQQLVYDLDNSKKAVDTLKLNIKPGGTLVDADIKDLRDQVKRLQTVFITAFGVAGNNTLSLLALTLQPIYLKVLQILASVKSFTGNLPTVLSTLPAPSNTQTVEFKLQNDIVNLKTRSRSFFNVLATHHKEIFTKPGALVLLAAGAPLTDVIPFLGYTHTPPPPTLDDVAIDTPTRVQYRLIAAKKTAFDQLTVNASTGTANAAAANTAVSNSVPWSSASDLKTAIEAELTAIAASTPGAAVATLTAKQGLAATPIEVKISVAIAKSIIEEEKLNTTPATATVTLLIPDPSLFTVPLSSAIYPELVKLKQAAELAANITVPAATKASVVAAATLVVELQREYAQLAANGGLGVAGSTIAFYEDIMKTAQTYETTFDQSLLQSFGLYKTLTTRAAQDMMVLPPSGGVAGVYASVDSDRGVWKAPANRSLASVLGPLILLNAQDQESLNVDANAGKSINVIRAFTGKGTLVWGTRTLAGNDNEWRYVPVRRFFNYAEESIKKATEPFVFEPNDINTWIRVKAMVENFLTLEWRRGALAGAKATDAFYVKVGLGETMTSLDILEGRMIVEIGMAVVRPAEFIILRFSHKMQES